jgi:hypothetical protein
MSKKILEKYSLKEAEQKVKTKRDFENQAIDLLKKLREFLDDNPHVPKEDKQIFGSVLKKIAGYTVIEDIEEVSEEVKIEKDTYEDLTPKDIKNISNNNEDKSLTITETYSKDEVLALISAKKKGYIVEGFVKKDQLMGKASLSFNKNTYITEGRMTKEQQQMFPKVFTIRYYKVSMKFIIVYRDSNCNLIFYKNSIYCRIKIKLNTQVLSQLVYTLRY